MATSKPDMTYAWAESGSKSNPGDSKIQSGWGAEIPTAEAHNWIWNRIDTFAQHVNENGIPQWDVDTDYQVGALTLRSGVLYQSLQTPNVNKVPGSAPTYWQLLSEAFNSPSSDEKDAMEQANSPDYYNPFATMDDLSSFDYDSGWVTVSTSDAYKAFTHSLGATEFSGVQVMMKDANNKPIVVAPFLNGCALSGTGSEASGFHAQAESVNEFRLYRAVNATYDGGSNLHYWLPNGTVVSRVDDPPGWAGQQPTHIRLKLKL